VFKRIRQLFSKPAPPRPEATPLTLGPGDICEVSLTTYQVTGRTLNQRRGTCVLTLQDGSDLRYLAVEVRERETYSLYTPIDGRLDSIAEVPMNLELDGRMFHLEEQYNGYITTSGKTPFMQGGDQSVWQYQSDDMKLMRIEWMDGRFMLYEGEEVLSADVRVFRGNPTT
jgi:hypothetical protein